MTERFGERVSALEKLLAAATPGPWKLMHYRLSPPLPDFVVVTDDKIKPHLNIAGPINSGKGCISDQKDWIEARANARLIAAAPEAIRALLTALREQQRALKACVSVIEAEEAKHTKNVGLRVTIECADAARAALQKWRIDE